MAVTQKLSADQVRQIEEIQAYQRVADRLKHLVTELEANRAGQTRVIQQLCEKIAHETSQMRQRALSSGIGTIADVAGAMSVMAGRGGGVLLKIRGLADGVNSLQIQLEAALSHARTPQEPKSPPQPKKPA
jgi:hypothetical protein